MSLREALICACLSLCLAQSPSHSQTQLNKASSQAIQGQPSHQKVDRLAERRARAAQRRRERTLDALGLPLSDLASIRFDPNHPEATQSVTDAMAYEFGLGRALPYTGLPQPTRQSWVFNKEGTLRGQLDHYQQFGALTVFATETGLYNPQQPYAFLAKDAPNRYQVGDCEVVPYIVAQGWPPPDPSTAETGDYWLRERWLLYSLIDVPRPDDWVGMDDEARDAWMESSQKQVIAYRAVYPVAGPVRQMVIRPLSYARYWRGRGTLTGPTGTSYQSRRTGFRYLPTVMICHNDVGERIIEPIVWALDGYIGEFPNWDEGELTLTVAQVDPVYGLPVVRPGGLRLHVHKRFPDKIAMRLTKPFLGRRDQP